MSRTERRPRDNNETATAGVSYCRTHTRFVPAFATLGTR
ncbi:unnamed protein product [Ectocarpus sp. 12 AP-2014]